MYASSKRLVKTNKIPISKFNSENTILLSLVVVGFFLSAASEYKVIPPLKNKTLRTVAHEYVCLNPNTPKIITGTGLDDFANTIKVNGMYFKDAYANGEAKAHVNAAFQNFERDTFVVLLPNNSSQTSSHRFPSCNNVTWKKSNKGLVYGYATIWMETTCHIHPNFVLWRLLFAR